MLVMRTAKDPANPIGEFISAQQTIGLDHFALAVDPLRLYGVLRHGLSLAKGRWMAFRTVREPHPGLAAIFLGGDSPRELARSVWLRRGTKASLERSPASKASRSSSENQRTKIGGLMRTTIAHRTQPTLVMH